VKKICKGCGRNRKIGKFARDSQKKDGKRIYCRDCISILNKRYRTSPIGRIKHKKSVDNWKKKNKIAIKKYNKAYYQKKKNIILYNKRAREDTESVVIVEKLDSRAKGQAKKSIQANKCNKFEITINPKRRLETNPI
jgi:hypothetical protein